MPLPGIKRQRPASDDEEEPGELIDDSSSSLSESETPKPSDERTGQSKRSLHSSSNSYREKEWDRPRERAWDHYDHSRDYHYGWHQSTDRSRQWSDPPYHRYTSRHASPPGHRQKYARGFDERHHHFYQGDIKRRKYSFDNDQDEREVSNYDVEHMKSDIDFAGDSLPLTMTTPEEHIQPHSPLEPPPDLQASEASCSPPVIEPMFVSEVSGHADHPENDESPSKMTKEELLHSMDLADREITEVEQQIEKLKRCLAQEELELEIEAQRAATEEAKEETKGDETASAVKTSNSDETAAEKEEEELIIPYSESTRNLILKIYAENRRRAAASRALLTGKGYPMPNPALPLYSQLSELPFYKENEEKAKAFHPVLVKHLHMKREKQLAFEKWQLAKYQQLQIQWKQTVDEWEKNPRRKIREPKIREFYERMFPEIRKQREREERIQRAQKSWNFARSDAELNEIADILHEQEIVQRQIVDLSVMPPCLLSEDERKVQFINRNGLVEDPMAEYKRRRVMSVWSDAEKKLFKEQFVCHPKDFDAIAGALPNKSVSDCVQYYYLSKKKEGYKQLVRKYTLAKRKNKVLQQRPQLAVGLDEQGHDFLEPLVSLDAEDDSKKPSGPSVQRWTDQEIQAMKEGLREYGKDWLTISVKVRTKTEHQCRSFFRHYKRKLHLVSFLNEFKAREKEALKPTVGISRIVDEDEDEEDEDLRKAAHVYSAQQPHRTNQPSNEIPSELNKEGQNQVGSTVSEIASRSALVPTPEHDQFISIAASMVDDYEKSNHLPESSFPQPRGAFPVISPSESEISGSLLQSNLPNPSTTSLGMTNPGVSVQTSTGAFGHSGLDLIAVASQISQTKANTVGQLVTTTTLSQKPVQVLDPRIRAVPIRPSIASPVIVQPSTTLSKPLTLHLATQPSTSQAKAGIVSPSGSVFTLLIPIQPANQGKSHFPTTQTLTALVNTSALASPIQTVSQISAAPSAIATSCPLISGVAVKGSSTQTVLRLAVKQVPYTQPVTPQLQSPHASRLTIPTLPTSATVTLLAPPPQVVSSVAATTTVTAKATTPTVCSVSPVVVGAGGIPLDHSDLVKTKPETPSSVIAKPTVLDKPVEVKSPTDLTTANQTSVATMDTSSSRVTTEGVNTSDASQLSGPVQKVLRATLSLPRQPSVEAKNSKEDEASTIEEMVIAESPAQPITSVKAGDAAENTIMQHQEGLNNKEAGEEGLVVCEKVVEDGDKSKFEIQTIEDESKKEPQREISAEEHVNTIDVEKETGDSEKDSKLKRENSKRNIIIKHDINEPKQQTDGSGVAEEEETGGKQMVEKELQMSDLGEEGMYKFENEPKEKEHVSQIVQSTEKPSLVGSQNEKACVELREEMMVQNTGDSIEQEERNKMKMVDEKKAPPELQSAVVGEDAANPQPTDLEDEMFVADIQATIAIRTPERSQEDAPQPIASDFNDEVAVEDTKQTSIPGSRKTESTPQPTVENSNKEMVCTEAKEAVVPESREEKERKNDSLQPIVRDDGEKMVVEELKQANVPDSGNEEINIRSTPQPTVEDYDDEMIAEEAKQARVAEIGRETNTTSTPQPTVKDSDNKKTAEEAKQTSVRISETGREEMSRRVTSEPSVRDSDDEMVVEEASPESENEKMSEEIFPQATAEDFDDEMVVEEAKQTSLLESEKEKGNKEDTLQPTVKGFATELVVAEVEQASIPENGKEETLQSTNEVGKSDFPVVRQMDDVEQEEILYSEPRDSRDLEREEPTKAPEGIIAMDQGDERSEAPDLQLETSENESGCDEGDERKEESSSQPARSQDYKISWIENTVAVDAKESSNESSVCRQSSEVVMFALKGEESKSCSSIQRVQDKLGDTEENDSIIKYPRNVVPTGSKASEAMPTRNEVDTSDKTSSCSPEVISSVDGEDKESTQQVCEEEFSGTERQEDAIESSETDEAEEDEENVQQVNKDLGNTEKQENIVASSGSYILTGNHDISQAASIKQVEAFHGSDKQDGNVAQPDVIGDDYDKQEIFVSSPEGVTPTTESDDMHLSSETETDENPIPISSEVGVEDEDLSMRYESISPPSKSPPVLPMSSFHETTAGDGQQSVQTHTLLSSDSYEFPLIVNRLPTSCSPSWSPLSPSIETSSQHSSPLISKSSSVSSLPEARPGAFLPSLHRMPSFGHGIFSPGQSPHRPTDHFSQTSETLMRGIYREVEDISSSDDDL